MILKLPLIFACATALTAASQSIKMVVDSAGNIAGRYVRTNADTYTVGVQDIFDVPKSGHQTVTFRADKGQGVIWCRQTGSVNVHESPSAKAPVIGQLIYEEGDVPDTYPCAGRKKAWYKVRLDDKTGYVAADSVLWDAIDTF